MIVIGAVLCQFSLRKTWCSFSWYFSKTHGFSISFQFVKFIQKQQF